MNIEQVLRDQFPVIHAARSVPHQPLAETGVRYVVSSQGLWRELSTAWLYALLPLAKAPSAMIPFGSLESTVEFRCSAPPVEFWRMFKAHAQQHLPNEAAAAFVWDEVLDDWRFAIRHPLSQGRAHIDYKEVVTKEGEHIVFDLHSHGLFPAGFSETDDKDDLGSIKIAAVLGNVGEGNTLVCRLNAIDQRLAIDIDAHGQLKVHLHGTLHSS
ncbi:PRTRC system protein A [Acidovorax soli]|uniref:PRTRC system protein A n=1 Tax=Acidovorax soli TaxID=592050 RepID=A0A1H4DU27_9BURK|nr:PRTRC system protein A [Acidovorax soli]SEA76009.1 PRTRC system protein A [Acidovorax soli]